jgi:hypothetical protein
MAGSFGGSAAVPRRNKTTLQRVNRRHGADRQMNVEQNRSQASLSVAQREGHPLSVRANDRHKYQYDFIKEQSSRATAPRTNFVLEHE